MNKSSSIARLLVIGGGFVLVVAGMRTTAHIVNIILMAYVVALLATPITRWLTKRHVPIFLAVVLVLLLIVVLILIVGGIVLFSVGQLLQDIPQYQEQLTGTVESVEIWLKENGIDISQIDLPNSISLSSLAQPALAAAEKAVAGVANVVINVGLVLVIVFFALFEVKYLPGRFSHAFHQDDHILNKLLAVNDGVRKYLVLKAVTGAVMAVANTTFLLVIGVQFAFLWGLLTFLMNFIPNIGFVIALIPPVIMAFLQYGLGTALLVLVGYLIINALVNTILAPRLMGQGLNLSPTIIFVALIFWAWVLGGVGVFMAVPLLIMMKSVADQYDDTKWLATAVSGDNPEPLEQEEMRNNDRNIN